MPSLPKPVKQRYRESRSAPSRSKSQRDDQAFYNSRQWRKLAAKYKSVNPECEVCVAINERREVDDLDHIVPIQKGGSKIESDNFMSMCKPHHNSKRGFEGHGYCVKTVQGEYGLLPMNRMEIIEKLINPKD